MKNSSDFHYVLIFKGLRTGIEKGCAQLKMQEELSSLHSQLK